jgi:AcrR family transcriptional regulator
MQTPAVARPRTKPAETRQEELMDAAQALFLSQGVDATTISDIVAAADVAKGTFYTYFASRTEILQALAQRYTRQFMAEVDQAVQQHPAGDGVARLRAWIRANIEIYVRTHALHDVVYANHHHHQRGNAERNAIQQQLLGILEAGNAAGLWQLPAPQVTASLIYAGVHGATDDLIATPHRMPMPSSPRWWPIACAWSAFPRRRAAADAAEAALPLRCGRGCSTAARTGRGRRSDARPRARRPGHTPAGCRPRACAPAPAAGCPLRSTGPAPRCRNPFAGKADLRQRTALPAMGDDPAMVHHHRHAQQLAIERCGTRRVRRGDVGDDTFDGHVQRLRCDSPSSPLRAWPASGLGPNARIAI